jgi:hypothetical protein
MRKLIVKIQYAIWAFQKINRPHIGDIVYFKGLQCTLIQGVSNPYWDLLPMTEENLAKEKRQIIKFIHRSDFELQKTFKRNLWAFKSSYKFQMQNWFLIDSSKPLFSRMAYRSL